MIGIQVQKAIFDALKASPAVAGGNVFDSVPEPNPFPRVTIGEEQILDDGNACGDGWQVHTDIHVWSREVGFPEAKTIAATVVERVRAISAVAGFGLISIELQDQRSVRDPDGLTSHIVCSFLFILDQA